MEAYYSLVRRLVNALETAGLDYAFTGALAVSFYGVPRSTIDIDVIVQVCGKVSQSRLANSLKQAGVRADRKQIDRALESGYKIVTFTDSKTAYSVDVILSSEKPEKKAGTAAGVQTFFQTPEDLISAKLRMIKATVPKERALKDEEDIRAILRFTGADVEKIRKEARKETTLSIFETLAVCENPQS